MNSLPTDLLFHIGTFLPTPDLLCYRATNSTLRLVVGSPQRRGTITSHLLEMATESTSDRQSAYFFPPIRQIQWIFNGTDLLLQIIKARRRTSAFYDIIFRLFSFDAQTVAKCCAFLENLCIDGKNFPHQRLLLFFSRYRRYQATRLKKRLDSICE